MNKFILFLLITLCFSTIYAQNESSWQRMNDDKPNSFEKSSTKKDIKNQLLFRLDELALRQTLSKIHDKKTNKNGTEILIPNLNGIMEKFLVWESSNFEPELQAKYPEIRAYAGIGITDSKASLNFSMSPKGIQTMVLRGGKGSEFIEPYSKDEKVYVLYNSKDRSKGNLPFVCKTEDVIINKQMLSKSAEIKASNKVFKTLRLALSCTGEYTAYFGGTVAGALAGMNATMTRVNGIFNKDLALKLNIIANNTSLIYTNAATDPYSDAAAGAAGAWNQELQDNLTSIVTNSGYDIGHLFGASDGGGNAGCIGCVCVNPTTSEPSGKGSAYTSPSNNSPEGDDFDIDYVVHEMGHQLGANHTFSIDIEGTGVNVEPGSGSTIMGYAGITDYNVQDNSDDYFAYASIFQIQSNLASKTCPVSTPIVNNPPTISAGSDYTIPKGTAFILKGTGSDAEGDSVTYCWEQYNSAITQDNANSIAFPTKVDGPLFRSIYPSTSPIRYMPNFSDVISNRLSSTWESISTVARTLHFTLTGRDNAALGKAQTATDEMIVNVSGTVGPFAVTSQDTDDFSWFQGTEQTITWSVNGTDNLLGSSNVNIKLSTDGGQTFPTILSANTQNDGLETITVPNITGTNCRILIEPVANIYYAVNNKPFTIGYSVSTQCNTYTFAASFAIPDTGAYISKTISVPDSSGIISDVNAVVGFKHSYLSDIQIEMVNPQGTIVKLFDRNCGSDGGNFLLNYDDLGGVLSCNTTTEQTVSPSEPLSRFNGQNPQGTWKLKVRDNQVTDTGLFKSASITICEKVYTLAAPSYEITDFTLYPNPNKGNFNIQFTSKFSNGVQVLVHDLLGRKLFENKYESKVNFNENIQLENAQPGLYLLTVMDGDRKEVKKMVIE